MSEDTAAPYEKAIEESAKATNNAIDLVREGGRAIGPAIADIYGLLIGDQVAGARKRRLDAIARKTKKILHDRDVKDQQELPEDIAIPLLEAAQSEPRESIQDLYAALLANAMDKRFSEDVRPEFIETVKELQPIDAVVLKFARDRYNEPSQRVFGSNHVYDALKKYRPTAIEVSLETLQRLKCINAQSQGLVLSPFGVELMAACDPHVGS